MVRRAVPAGTTRRGPQGISSSVCACVAAVFLPWVPLGTRRRSAVSLILFLHERAFESCSWRCNARTRLAAGCRLFVGHASGMLRAYVSPTHLVVPRISRVCLPITERCCWLNKSGETKSKITITCLISQTTPARPPATRATRGVAGTVVAPSRGGCIYKILNLQNCKSSQSHYASHFRIA